MATAAIGTLAVRFAAITAEFDADLKKVSGSLQKVAATAQRVAQTSGVAFVSMAAGLGLATKAASESLAGQRKLAAAFQASGEALDLERYAQFASALQATTTVEDDAIVALGSLMGAMGASQREVEALVPGILDLAAATGKAAEDIGQKLAMAVQSGDADLKRYGITLSDAEKEQFKLGSTADRTAMLVAKLGAFSGQASAEASTATGRFTMMNNALGEVLESVGKIIDAPLAGMFETVQRLALGVSNALDGMSPMAKDVAAAFALVGTALTGVTSGIATLIAFGPQLAKMFSAMSAAASITATTVLPLALAIVGIAAGLVLIAGVAKKMGRAIAGGETAKDIEDRQAGFFATLKASFAEGAKAYKDLFTNLVPELPAMPTGAAPTSSATSSRGGGLDWSGAQRALSQGSYSGDFSTGGMGSGEIDDWYSKAVERIRNRWDSSADRFEEQMRVVDSQIQEFGMSAAQSLVGSMGEAGQVVLGAVRGFQQAGPFGLIAGIVTGILQQSSTFKNMSANVNKVFGELMATIEPLIQGFEAFIGTANILGRWLNDFLAPTFRWLGAVIGFFGRTVAASFLPLMYIAKGIAIIWNKIIDVLIWVMKKLDKIPRVDLSDEIKAMRRGRVDIGEINDTIANLGDVARGASTGIEDLAAATDAATASMLNAPEGFKVSLARYNATIRGGGAIPVTSNPELVGAAAPVVQVETVIVQAQDPVQLAQQLTRISEINTYHSTGSISGSGTGRMPTRLVP